VIDEHDAAVIATAGGIVSDAETYALLLRRSHTVWVRASPDEHMKRVMEQGDFRPMAQNREAMADLVAILEARRPDYARAQAELDTSGDTIECSFGKLQDLVKRWLDGERDIARPSALRIETGAGGH
jgi:XRE family aerobic/anaerobic benzoate catabolism transcriptional regulator